MDKTIIYLIIFALFASFSCAQQQIDWLILQQSSLTGLVDSYEGDSTNRAYTYDQALAAIAFTAAGETGRAKSIFDKFRALQNSDGSWYKCYDASNGNACESNRWAGDIAWMVMAINYYESYTEDKSYANIAVKALGFLDTLRDTNIAHETYGALLMEPGSDAFSTENNYDAYSAYRYRGFLSKNDSLTEKANLIRAYLEKEMWSNSSSSNGPYHDVGVFWVGYNNFEWYTDAQSWGVLALGPVGSNGENFTRALEWLYTYGYGYGSTRHTQTYNSQIDGFDFWTKPAKNSTWIEGTEGVAAAYYSIGDKEKGDYFHGQTEYAVSGNGGLIYSFSETNPANIYFPDNYRYNSIASTAWHYLNEKRINPFRLVFKPELQKGFTMTSWWNDDYLQPVSDESIVMLDGAGVEYVSLVVTWYQDSVSSTNIYRDSLKTPSDDALIHAIDKAHSLGMKAMLKPHIDVADGSWRGDIKFSNEADWNAWFLDYSDFINYYAAIAEQSDVELFSVGTELKGTSSRETDWENIIAGVRNIYSGALTYAANWDDYTNINWWDKLDYAGIDAYFALTAKTNPTLQELKDGWNVHKNALSAFYDTWKKPIIFTEIGYQSIDGTNMHPWWSSGDTDLQEQADSYRAAFESLFGEPWFYGMHWWDWYYEYSNDHDSFGIYGKPALDVVKEFYKTNYFVNETIDGSKTEYRFYYNNHHFLTIVDDNGTFNIRPHPGADENGWGSSLYMQPFLPGAALKHSVVDKIAAYSDGIKIIANGFVSKNSGSTYGTWDVDIKFSYNTSVKEITGNGTYSIVLDNNLSSSTGDLNLFKIASNYLDDVPLLTGGNGDTGDMKNANISGNGFSYVWNPSEQSAFYPQDKTEHLSIDVIGQLNNADSAAQGYAAIEPAYKPSLKVVLNSKQTGIPMIFGGAYDSAKSKQFWEDNVRITPLVLKESAFTEYNFDVLVGSSALPNDGIDADFDGYNYNNDCNESNALINPSATEVCDGKDNDCNEGIDEGCVVIGDVNKDGTVDVFDVQLCINQALGLAASTPEADVNNDGTVDVFDVQLIINKALGLYSGKICNKRNCLVCKKGKCKAQFVCSSNAQCGKNGWIGIPSCSNKGDVYQNYITYTCNNAGKISASCSNKVTRKVKQDCTASQICSSGQCRAKRGRSTNAKIGRR